MKLEVQQDGVIIPVNRNTIRNAKSNLEFLKARRAILLTGIEKLNREKSSLQDKLQDYLGKNTPITAAVNKTNKTCTGRLRNPACELANST